jgi:hypothetical protein
MTRHVHDEVDVGRPGLGGDPAGEAPAEGSRQLVATPVFEAEHRTSKGAFVLTPDHGALLRW